MCCPTMPQAMHAVADRQDQQTKWAAKRQMIKTQKSRGQIVVASTHDTM